MWARQVGGGILVVILTIYMVIITHCKFAQPELNEFIKRINLLFIVKM